MKKIYIIIGLLIVSLLSSCYNETYNSLYYALEFDSNYTYTLVENDKVKQTFLFNDGNIKTIINEDGIKSLIYVKEEKYIIKTLTSGTNVLIESTNDEFRNLKEKYFIIVFLENLNYKDFTENEVYYTLNNSKLDSVSMSVFDNTFIYDFESLEIKVFGKKVYEIKVNYYLDTILKKEMKLLFSSFNSTVFDIPSEFNDVLIKNIVPSIKTINVENGTLLTEALDGVYVTVIYEDNKTLEYSIDDLEYTCKDYNASAGGNFTVTINILNKSVDILINVESLGYFVPTDIETLDDFALNNNITYGMPSTGNSKALVIPVEFTDYRAKVNMKEDLQKAFFGTSEDTGWESLTSYYKKASYGKLNIEGTVLDVYNTGNSSSYYNRKYERGQDADYMIIKQALEYYDSQIDYSDFDSNNDGYIDALYIVYTTPVDYKSDTSMWWAFTYEYFTTSYEFYDGVEADYYCFMGYDFLFESPSCGKSLTYNAETIIHETGHILGLDDYYDYDEDKGPNGGIGGGDMMDYNVGDHNPFSKILMGWVTPYVVTDSTTINLSSFGQTGGCILLIDKFSSIYDEYYLIDLYTPDGLNKLEAGNNGLFSISGIRMYHIDARISSNSFESILEIYDYDNSYTDHRLISLVQASGSNSIDEGKFGSNSDLLSFNTNFTINSWYSKNNLSFTINAVLKEDLTVDINIIKK